MIDEKNLDDGWGCAYKCGGIPWDFDESYFKIDDPIEMTEEYVKARRKKLSQFLDKYGLKLHDELE